MATALVIGNIDLPRRSVLDPLVRRADLVVAADGGANRAADAGIKVDYVIGDMDGIQPSIRRSFAPGHVLEDTDPDHTDLEKCLDFLAKRNIRRVFLTGVVGGRLDHTLANVAILLAWHRRLDLTMVDDLFVSTVVEGRTSFRAPKGTVVSLVAPTGASGVTTRGLRFPLKDASLAYSPLGVHNEVVRSPVSIRVTKGRVVLMRSHEPNPIL